MRITLQERIARYLERDFPEDQARILILMEEAAIALFEKGTTLIPTASRDYLLLQKAESFVSRSIMKTRDAFFTGSEARCDTQKSFA